VQKPPLPLPSNAGIRLPAALLMLLLAAAGGCRRGAPSGEQRVRQVIEDITMTQTVRGVKLWELRAPEARVALAGAADLVEPEVRFFHEGRHASTARARKASVSGDSKDVALREDVVIVSHRENATLRTEEMQYSAGDQKFRTDLPVRIEGPNSVMRGRGLEADAALSAVTVYNQETILR